MRPLAHARGSVSGATTGRASLALGRPGGLPHTRAYNYGMRVPAVAALVGWAVLAPASDIPKFQTTLSLVKADIEVSDRKTGSHCGFAGLRFLGAGRGAAAGDRVLRG